MSINQPPASATVSRIAPSETQKTSKRRFADYAYVQRVRAGFVKIESATGWLGLAAVSVGVVLAVCCTVWAIHEGVPYPLAIMVGYCTVIGSAGFCAALLAIQRNAAKTTPASTKRGPNYAAWKLVSKLRISDASRLWCDIEPGWPATQESTAWGIAMLDAVKRGELRTIASAGAGQAAGGQEQRNANWSTEIGRDALISWAKAHGHSPRFLQK